MTPGAPAYGRRTSLGTRHSALGTYAGQTYYGRPAIKPSHYKWLISAYLFTGGLAGASQIIATVADVFGRPGDRGLVRAGRYLALAGSLLSPIFLIKDLQTPRRFHNMMRIFRPTSPMSVGSWTLAAFGTLSGLTALGQLVHDVTLSRRGRRGQGESALGVAGWFARLASLPAAAAGAVMSCYTGSLLSATSVPFWAVVWKWLPPLFGSSAMSTASAATSLAMQRAGVSEETHTSMERLALAASTAELAFAIGCGLKWRKSGLDAPLRQDPKLVWAYRIGALELGILVPLIIHLIQVLTGKRWSWASKLASISALAGGFSQRAALTFAGNASAERPQDYFRLTAPGHDGHETA